MTYLFRDTDRAARRLQVLAEVYTPSSEAFLQDIVHTQPQLALDLGCGPGYTTHLLAKTTRSAQTIGLDSSTHFIELATKSATGQISFLQHDVTQTPFPVGPADLIFCRMLLTHLQDPQATIERWLTQLKPGGLLLIEEVDWINTDKPILRDYLAIVAAMLKQQHNQLYIGEQLDAHQPTASGIQRPLSRVYQLPVTTANAATMFYLNIQTWKNHPFIQQNYPITQIEQMEDELGTLTTSTSTHNEITWGMRQIAYQKT
ncbi:class I SAM-dependent methyltransferase [Dictyobacter formicarum]|uniref:Methyltransferase type 11 domain-containing protein n=1 Tax=Dictyobacter formicarum TaxID=2778368 RepID=A0ABQ3VIJ8_9CHLR|nr:class I SAM-dependent methyltransferase [Dictyobacter formicarum]GHO85885.1 hypothetical protein KSZ_38910 [Dictyobacter formicarum]